MYLFWKKLFSYSEIPARPALLLSCLCFYELYLDRMIWLNTFKGKSWPNTQRFGSALCTTNGQSSAFPSSLLLRTLHQQFESYKQEVRRIGAETRRQHTQQKDDAPTCGICRKTKFADGCGHLCSYCQTKFCARCGGRVSLRSNNVRNLNLTSSFFFLPLTLTSSLL